MNKQIRNKFMDTEDKLMIVRWVGEKSEGIKKIQIANYKSSHGT